VAAFGLPLFLLRLTIMELFDQINESASFIASRIAHGNPEIAIILGSGLGALADLLEQAIVIPYKEIPNFPVTTVKGHKGRLLYGKLHGKELLLMDGRFHYYEGNTVKDVTFPVRVMKALGIKTLLLSNAAGGTNISFRAGDLMVITDHINLLPEHPLRGTNDERLGVRFPNMSNAYNASLITLAKEAASSLNIPLREGVYVGLQGPSFETRAEYKFIARIGGDAVGMSTVPEVIVARHAGIEVFAISVIANIGIQDTHFETTHEEVLDAVSSASPKMAALISEMIKSI